VDRDGKTFERRVESTKFKSCPESAEYQKYIETAAKYFVEPQRLGNLAEAGHRYDCQIKNPDEAVALAAKTIDEWGDPYTKVYNKKALAAEDRARSNDLVGAGFGLDKDDRGWKVFSVVPEAPAEKADLRARDHIVSLNGQPTGTMSAPEIVDVFRSGV